MWLVTPTDTLPGVSSSSGEVSGPVLRLVMYNAQMPTRALERFPAFLGMLPAEFRRLLGPVIELQAQILNSPVQAISFPKRPPGTDYSTEEAEVFSDGDTLYVLTLLKDKTNEGTQALRMLQWKTDPRNRRRSKRGEIPDLPEPKFAAVNLHVIGTMLKTSRINLFTAAVNQAFDVELTRASISNRVFNNITQTRRERVPEFSEQDTYVARLLADKTIRRLAIKIKSSGGLLLTDVPNHLAPDSVPDADTVQASLLAHGLISSQAVVICRKSSLEVARLPSDEALGRVAAAGMKCKCGRGLQEERIEKGLSITDYGRQMLDGSRWFTILVASELQELGLQPDEILVDQQIGPDEMDLFANICGQLVLFELKDKEFSLGNAYAFGGKLGIYRPGRGIIITTEHVGGDANDHLARAGYILHKGRRRFATIKKVSTGVSDIPLTHVEYVEGLENLRGHLEQVISSAFTNQSIEILKGILPRACIDPVGLIRELADSSGAVATP
jgi:hypothetical protein